MNKGIGLITSLGLGAGMMYLLDPERGNRRRKLLSDQVNSLLSQSDNAVSKTSRDLSNRVQGLMAEIKSMVTNEQVTDDVLVGRVRSRMGRFVSHPKAIDVTANQGRVTLSGPILANEVDGLLSCVSSVRGVSGVENQLEVHERPDNVPALQGGTEKSGARTEFMQGNWSPTARLLAGASGGSLVLRGLTRGGLVGLPLAILGLGMLTRGVTNIETQRLIGIKGGRRVIDFEKTFNIDAPVEEVYEFFNNYQNWPRFMSNIREVRELGDGLSHWVASGPAGMPVEWDSIIKQAPHEMLEWESVPGSMVRNSGKIRFQPNPEGGTRVHIQFSYNPPAGALGHSVATLFGANPRREMDQDMLRLKSLIEEGKTSVGHQTVTLEETSPERGATH